MRPNLHGLCCAVQCPGRAAQCRDGGCTHPHPRSEPAWADPTSPFHVFRRGVGQLLVCSTMCISHLPPPLGPIPIISDSFSSWKVLLISPMRHFTSIFLAAQSKMSPCLLASCCCSAESLFLPCFFASSFLGENCLLFPARENGDQSSSPAPNTGEYNIGGGLMPLKLLSPHACGSTSPSAPSPGVLGCLLGSSAQRVEN